MIKFDYYIVTTYFDSVPFFTTCALVNDNFYRISDFDSFIKDGKSGITDEVVTSNGFKLISSINFSV
jgi:hypothetical protein